MTSQPVSEVPTPRFALLIVFLTVFIDLLGFGIVLPVMPRQAEPYLDELGVSQIMAGGIIGVLFSVFHSCNSFSVRYGGGFRTDLEESHS